MTCHGQQLSKLHGLVKKDDWTLGHWRFRDAFYEVNAITSVETEHANRLKGSISNSKMTVKEVGST